MTRPQLERLVAVWQQRLGLDGWDITVDFDKAAPAGVLASMTRKNWYDRATLRLAKGWTRWDDKAAGRVVVHELLHLATRDVDQVFESAQKLLHPDAGRVFNDRYEHEIEGCIDRLAVRLVELAG